MIPHHDEGRRRYPRIGAKGHGHTGGRALGRRRARLDWIVLEDRRLLTTFVVNNPSDTLTAGLPTPHTLRWAVEQANAATRPSTIRFALGPRPTTITLAQGQLELTNTAAPVTITGPGADRLTLDGDHAGRVLLIEPNVTASISGVTFADGAPSDPYPLGYGGDIWNQGAVTLSGVALRDGGPVAFGGGMANSGTATLIDCTVTGSNSQFGYGALFNQPGASMTLLGGSLINASLANHVAEASVTGTAIQVYHDYGVMSDHGTLTMTHCTISGGSALEGTDGGGPLRKGVGVRIDDQATIIDCTFKDIVGISIFNDGDLTVVGSRISGNTGAGVQNLGSLTMTGCAITDNSYSGYFANDYYGGGVFNGGGHLTMTDCAISGNYASDRGGGLYNGWAFGVIGTADLTNCTISGNSSRQGGGVSNGAALSLTNCTISGNSATEEGGGMFNYGTASLVACTISGNTAPEGGGLDNYSSPYYTSRTTLIDTIVAGNTTGSGAASDVGGPDPGDVTGSYNLIGTGGSGGLAASDHNLLGVADPGLAPLGWHGGPTETMALLPGSPAIHNGIAAPGVTTDQRGLSLDSPPDIGAFQTQPGCWSFDAALESLGSPLGKVANLADATDGGLAIPLDDAAVPTDLGSPPSLFDIVAHGHGRGRGSALTP